jgi:hypothetical protein
MLSLSAEATESAASQSDAGAAALPWRNLATHRLTHTHSEEEGALKQ